jgi:hypothetical protein
VLGLPEEKMVVGFCGGFPLERGALQVLDVVKTRSDCFGVIIGRVRPDEEHRLRHPRMLLIGEIPFVEVPKLLSCFDVGFAFDDVARADSIGNSNQKVRQYLAAGAFVITRCSDIDFAAHPFAGIDVPDMSSKSMSVAMEMAVQAKKHREMRREYARRHLDVASIFEKRHSEIENVTGTRRV